MKRAITVALLLVACSPRSPKTYTTPEIKMDMLAFQQLCGYIPDDRHTLRTEQTVTDTIINGLSDSRPASCAGTFTFVNNELSSIEH